MEITVKNQFGENIHVKIENNSVLVHHEDCSDSFMPLSELFMKYLIPGDELVLIYNAIRTITPELKDAIDIILKQKVKIRKSSRIGKLNTDYIKNIVKLCGKADNPGLGYAQVTIDFFEAFENQFFDDSRDLSEFPVERDEIGAKRYDVSILLDVIDRQKFAIDVDIFKELYKELNIWAKAIEDRNILLGIPKHKG